MTKSGRSLCVGVISLGCPKNLVDTERMLGALRHRGHRLTDHPEEADLLVVNTCGFKADAEEESREAIAAMVQVKRDHPGKRLVVTGCLSQRYGAALRDEIPDIDLLLGSAHYDQLWPWMASHEVDTVAPVHVAHLPTVEPLPGPDQPPRVLTTPAHTAYVKIAEGCNNPCTFCIIPQLRGRFRSRQREDIVAEVTALARQGVREINLVSQDTTLYGRDLSPRTTLAELLKHLAAIDGIRWIRTLYLYPTLLTKGLLRVMAEEEKVLPYLDIPLQHSHASVLARMKRAERPDDLRRLFDKIDTYLPQATLRTTFIVGFPGEHKKMFNHLYALVDTGRFDHVGVFTYSDEKGTPAYDLPDKVKPKTAEKRRQALMLLQQKISRRKLKKQVGTCVPVLVDGVSEASQWLLEGRTMGQAPEVDGMVYINDGTPHPGTIVPVTITESHDYDLVGYVTKEGGHA